MANDDAPQADTNAMLAVIAALMLKLVRKGVLTVEEATEPFDAALAAAETLPCSPSADRLRLALEHAASRLSAIASE